MKIIAICLAVFLIYRHWIKNAQEANEDVEELYRKEREKASSFRFKERLAVKRSESGVELEETSTPVDKSNFVSFQFKVVDKYSDELQKRNSELVLLKSKDWSEFKEVEKLKNCHIEVCSHNKDFLCTGPSYDSCSILETLIKNHDKK